MVGKEQIRAEGLGANKWVNDQLVFDELLQEIGNGRAMQRRGNPINVHRVNRIFSTMPKPKPMNEHPRTPRQQNEPLLPPSPPPPPIKEAPWMMSSAVFEEVPRQSS